MDKKRYWLALGAVGFLLLAVATHGAPAATATSLIAPSDEVVITLGDPITANGPGVTISGSTATIVAGGTYRVTGTLADGMLAINTTETVEVILDNASITNTTGPAIKVIDAPGVSVVLASSSTNTLVDGPSYSGAKGTLFSNDPLVISGDGALMVTGHFKHGIVSDDTVVIEGGRITISATTDGIHANDNITVNGGTIDVTQSNDGLESEGNFVIAGGALTVAAQDDGIVSADTLVVSDGSLEIVSGDDGLNASNGIAIDGGQIFVDATGDAMDSGGALAIHGGLTVALGGEGEESGLDCGACEIAFGGGTVVATGGTNSTPSSASQQYVVVLDSTPASSLIDIEQGGTGGTTLLTFEVSKAYQNMLFTSPAIEPSMTSVGLIGGTVSGGTNFHGLITGATYSGGHLWVTFTTNTVVTYVGAIPVWRLLFPFSVS